VGRARQWPTPCQHNHRDQWSFVSRRSTNPSWRYQWWSTETKVKCLIHGSIRRLCKIFHSQPMQPKAARNRVLSRHVKQNIICLPQACSTSWRDVFQCWWIVPYPHLERTAWLVYLRSSGSKWMQTSIYDRWNEQRRRC
jgi:hypothetical protein